MAIVNTDRFIANQPCSETPGPKIERDDVSRDEQQNLNQMMAK